MTNRNENAYAYGFCTADGSSIMDQPGLSKREYFAAMALQGILAAHNIYETGVNNEVNARTAVNAADWLIKALNEKP